jgi:hypothetical protein
MEGMRTAMPEDREPLRIGPYVLAPELFELGYAAGCGPGGCGSTCCNRGAYVDLVERDRILAHKDLVKAHMDEGQSQDDALWFEHDEKADADFPSGKCVGTAEIGGKCAFLDQHGRCSLQTAASAHGMHKWALKPTYCILYPIDLSDNVIKFDFRLQGRRSCCSISASFEVPAFEACREELAHLLGEDGVEALVKHARALHGARKQLANAEETLQQTPPSPKRGPGDRSHGY